MKNKIKQKAEGCFNGLKTHNEYNSYVFVVSHFIFKKSRKDFWGQLWLFKYE